MTPAERRKPELLKASRKRRIAAGAGVQVQEVNRLLAQFENMQKMMKMMRGATSEDAAQHEGIVPGGKMRSAVGAALAACALAAAGCASGQVPAAVQSAASANPLAPFGWFADLAGACWKGEYPDKVSSDTQCYLAQYDSSFAARPRAVTQAGSPDQLRGRCGVRVGREARPRALYPVGFGGHLRRGEITTEGEALVFHNILSDGTESDVRSVWRRAGPDGFRVVRERKGDEGWKEFLAVDYKRVR
jgi:hypothetical protein